jgi:hypothetical protein
MTGPSSFDGLMASFFDASMIITSSLTASFWCSLSLHHQRQQTSHYLCSYLPGSRIVVALL